MPTVYLITHPEVVIDPRVPVPQWPLSERGRERMRRCLEQPWVAQIRAVHCSAERKAMDGAEILARHVGCQPQVWEALGEVDRSSTGYLPREEHEALARLLFARPEESVRGWERAIAAQRRMVAAIAEIVVRDASGGDIAIVSHGGVGRLYLAHLQTRPIPLSQPQPDTGGGCYFAFEAPAGKLVHGWRPIDEL